MVSILSVKWAKPVAAPVLIEEFLRAPDHSAASLKWTIGDALSVVADDSVFDNLVIIVQNKQHGKAREMIATALGNMNNPRAIDVLIDLLQDEDVAGHALIALGRLKAGKARHYIEPFLNHSKSWIRKEANRALAKIDKGK
jgi:HEAT repeat protein